MWATVYVEKDFNETQKHKTIGKKFDKTNYLFMFNEEHYGKG